MARDAAKDIEKDIFEVKDKIVCQEATLTQRNHCLHHNIGTNKGNLHISTQEAVFLAQLVLLISHRDSWLAFLLIQFYHIMIIMILNCIMIIQFFYLSM